MTTQTSWEDVSTITFGLLVTKREPVTNYNPDVFYPPFDEGFKQWKKSSDINKLIDVIGNNVYEMAIAAASTVSDSSEVEWPSLLHRSAKLWKAGDAAEKLARNMKLGKPVDDIKLIEMSSRFRDLSHTDGLGLVELNSVDTTNYKPYRLTGWPNVDNFFGGLSTSRMNLLGADSGLGKTTWAQRLADCWLKYYPNSKVAVYTLELSKENWKARAEKHFPDLLRFGNRLMLSSRSVNINEVGLEITSTSDVDLCIVDSASYLVPSDTPENYASLGRQTNELCREWQHPFVMLAQFNATRGFTKVHTKEHFAYGRPLVDVAGNVFTLGRFQTDEDTEGHFTYLDSHPDAIMAWKQGDGWKNERGKAGGVFMPRIRTQPWALDDGMWQYHGEVEKQEVRRR